MARYRSSPALVIRVQDQGESDKLVLLETLAAGRVHVIAKGAKRSKRRFCNKLELFSLLQATWAVGRTSLHRLEAAELVEPFAGLRRNPPAFAAAAVIAEQLCHWSREDDPHPQVFHTSCQGLTRLHGGDDPGQVVAATVAHLLTLYGYQPQLDRCQGCGSPDGPFTFLPSRHGLACRRCRPAPGGRFLSGAALASLAHLMAASPARGRRLRMGPAVAAEVLGLLESYAGFLLQRDLPAWRVFRALAGADRRAA